MAILKLPPKSITYLSICGGMVLAFILLAIYPYHKALGSMDMEIQKINAKIDEQKILHPVFQELLKRSRIKEPTSLTLPKKEILSRADTGKILSIFQEIAQRSNLEIKSVQPDVEALIDNSEHLMVDVVMTGAFFDFRNFFLQLGGLPYLKHIERFQIKTEENVREINLRIWLSLG
ncbi:type 4a pilus biogenesis protein PilO [Thermodesulfobacteriota bacterium]